jgi:hypothetical protein
MRCRTRRRVELENGPDRVRPLQAGPVSRRKEADAHRVGGRRAARWVVGIEHDECRPLVLVVRGPGPDQIVKATSPAGAVVHLDASASRPQQGTSPTCLWGDRTTATILGHEAVVDVTLPPGVTTVTLTLTLTMTDEAGQSATDTVTVTVRETTPPTVEVISVGPCVIWPPNHQMCRVQVHAIVSDAVDPAPVCRVRSVSSNEPVDGPGDGDTAPDWIVGPGLSVDLRAERAGGGSGRIYTITVECVDAAGNRSLPQTVTISVPRHLPGPKA